MGSLGGKKDWAEFPGLCWALEKPLSAGRGGPVLVPEAIQVSKANTAEKLLVRRKTHGAE